MMRVRFVCLLGLLALMLSGFFTATARACPS
jgi:hypothetical protein